MIDMVTAVFFITIIIIENATQGRNEIIRFHNYFLFNEKMNRTAVYWQ